MMNPLVVLEITSSGWVEHKDHPIIPDILPKLSSGPAKTIATLQLYPLLPLLPRWAGMEEDDDLAGPSTSSVPASNVSGIAHKGAKGKKQPSATAEGEEELKKSYTREELSGMGNKMLGRLKAQGVDVDEFLKRKGRGGKAAKRRRLRGKKDEEGEGDMVEGEEEGMDTGEGEGDLAEEGEVDVEEKMNAA